MSLINRADIRDVVVEALRGLPAFSQHWVDKWSDDPEDWMEQHLASDGGSMIVSYAGTTTQEGSEAVPGRQSAVHVVLFERSEDEGLSSLDALESEIEGLRVTVEGRPVRLHFHRDNFIGEQDGFYQYEAQLRAELL